VHIGVGRDKPPPGLAAHTVTLKAAVDPGAVLESEVELGFLERHWVSLAVAAAGSDPARITAGVALASAGGRQGLSPAAAEAVAAALLLEL